MDKHDWMYIVFDGYRCRKCGKTVIIGNEKENEKRNKRLLTEKCPGKK